MSSISAPLSYKGDLLPKLTRLSESDWNLLSKHLSSVLDQTASSGLKAHDKHNYTIPSKKMSSISERNSTEEVDTDYYQGLLDSCKEIYYEINRYKTQKEIIESKISSIHSIKNIVSKLQAIIRLNNKSTTNCPDFTNLLHTIFNGIDTSVESLNK